MTFPSLAEWQLEALRVVFLSKEPVSGAQKNWWETAVGSAPESISSRPAQNEHQETGIVDGAQLTMTTKFNQLEWLLFKLPQAGITNERPNLGTVEESLHLLDEIIQRFVKESEFTFQRFAFCPTLYRSADDLSQANRIATTYFPILNDTNADIEDVFGQFNISIKSQALPDVKINRILKVSAAHQQTFTITNSPVPIISNRFATHMELDLNTALQRSEPIPNDTFPALLEEIQTEIIKVISKGLL